MSLPCSAKSVFLSSDDISETIPTDTVNDIRSVCKELLGSAWKSIPDEKLKVCVVTGGISNALFKVTPSEADLPETKGPFSVLVRVFGPGDRDRETENSLVTHLDKVGFGPKIYGFFENGRIEGFINNSRSLDYSEMRKPEFLGRIAAQLSTLHNLDMPGDNKPILFSTLNRWYETAESSGFDVDPESLESPKEKEKNRIYQSLNIKYVAEQLQWLQHVLPSKENDYGTDLLSNRACELLRECHFAKNISNVTVSRTQDDSTKASCYRIESPEESDPPTVGLKHSGDWTLPSIATPWLAQLKSPKIVVSTSSLAELSKTTIPAVVSSPRILVETKHNEETGESTSHLLVEDTSSQGPKYSKDINPSSPPVTESSPLYEIACVQARIDAACFLYRTVFAHNDLLAGNILEVSTPPASNKSTPLSSHEVEQGNSVAPSSRNASPSPKHHSHNENVRCDSSDISTGMHSGREISPNVDSQPQEQETDCKRVPARTLEKLSISSVEQVPEPSPRTPNITSLQYLSTLPPLQIIDYEYSSFNPAGFDIANHFLEFAGFDFDLSLFPSSSAMAEWFVAYFAVMDVTIPTIHSYFPPNILANAKIPVSTSSSSATNAVNESSRPTASALAMEAHGNEFDPSEPVFDVVSSAFFDELFRLIYLFTLPSHYFWGLWAIIQARYSSIPFDYMSYAKRRLDGYNKQKQEFSKYLPR